MLHCYIFFSVVVLFVKWEELMKLAFVKLLQKKCIIDCNCSKTHCLFANFFAKMKKNIFIDL